MNKTVTVMVCLALASICAWGADRTPAKVVSAEKAMARELKAPSFSGTLEAALQRVQELAGVRVVASWRVLNACGARRTQPIQVKAKKATVGQFLDMILAKCASGAHPLAWYADDDLVVVTGQNQALDRRVRLAPRAPAAPKRSAARSTAKLPAPRSLAPAGSEGLNFDEVPLKDVILYLRQRSGVSIHVNWRALAVAGIDQNTTVTLKLRNVTMRRVLDLLTEQLSASRDRDTSLYWIIDRGVVSIATGAAFNTDLSVRVIDVADLLFIVPNFKGPRIELNQEDLNSGRNDRSSGTGSGSFFEDDMEGGGGERGREFEEEDIREVRERVRKTLVEVIKESIGEEMWHPTGKGNVRLLGDKMIVSQTKLGFLLLAKSGVLH